MCWAKSSPHLLTYFVLEFLASDTTTSSRALPRKTPRRLLELQLLCKLCSRKLLPRKLLPRRLLHKWSAGKSAGCHLFFRLGFPRCGRKPGGAGCGGAGLQGAVGGWSVRAVDVEQERSGTATALDELGVGEVGVWARGLMEADLSLRF